MLIDYSIRSYELLERKLTHREKADVLNVFTRVGTRMGLQGLPHTFEEWENMRDEHLQNDLKHSPYTHDLFRQYRKHLGPARYRILVEAQSLVTPPYVRRLLQLHSISLLQPLIALYKILRSMNADWLLKELILPGKYKKDIRAMDIAGIS